MIELALRSMVLWNGNPRTGYQCVNRRRPLPKKFKHLRHWRKHPWWISHAVLVIRFLPIIMVKGKWFCRGDAYGLCGSSSCWFTSEDVLDTWSPSWPISVDGGVQRMASNIIIHIWSLVHICFWCCDDYRLWITKTLLKRSISGLIRDKQTQMSKHQCLISPNRSLGQMYRACYTERNDVNVWESLKQIRKLLTTWNHIGW